MLADAVSTSWMHKNDLVSTSVTPVLQEQRVFLLGPYSPDRLHSMERYTRLLHEGLIHAGWNAKVLQPRIVLGKLHLLPTKLRKYAHFLDKFLFFAAEIKRVVRGATCPRSPLIHILDQGNALYASRLARVPLVITCHDLIAAKAALADSTNSSRRWSGRNFHHHNLRALQRADLIVGVSDKTIADCREMFNPRTHLPLLRRVYNPLDPSFDLLLGALSPPSDPPFLLHVGNSAWYKNRLGLLKIYAALRHIMPEAPALHIYGEPLRRHESTMLAELKLDAHVVCFAGQSNEAIRLAYQQAQALIFPSLEEGFGWPVLEAMASGCPVFTSNFPPLTEIGGDAVEYIAPEDPTSAAAIIANQLQCGKNWRKHRATAGKERASLFNMETFIAEMVNAYETTLALRGI